MEEESEDIREVWELETVDVDAEITPAAIHAVRNRGWELAISISTKGLPAIRNSLRTGRISLVTFVWTRP